MDPRSTVEPPVAGAEVVLAEQAVFTSTRSAWGRGYRIIAASAGIAADEKRELVQRAPSHRSICDASPHGRGLASFTLQSRRRCVFLSQNAGPEHSARGDYRVHTHILVMEPAAYRRLRCDPLVIASGALAALGADLLSETPPERLSPLSLALGAATKRPGGGNTPPPSAGEIDSLTAVLSRVLRGHRILVTGIADPLQVLAWIWPAVPAAARDLCSLSCGLRFSPGRSFRLVLADAARSEAQRIGLDHDFEVVEWSSAGGPVALEFGQWLSSARRRWAAGRLAELDQFSAELGTDTSAADWACAAALCDDIEQLQEADLALVELLVQRHAGAAPRSSLGARLHAQLLDAAAARRKRLQPEREEPDSVSEHSHRS